MAKKTSSSGESFGVDDIRLKWSSLEVGRERGREEERERGESDYQVLVSNARRLNQQTHS